MAFRPDEIATKRFVTRWRGFDRGDVQDFLRVVAGDYRDLLSQLSGTPEAGDRIDLTLSRLEALVSELSEETVSSGALAHGPRPQRLVRVGGAGSTDQETDNGDEQEDNGSSDEDDVAGDGSEEQQDP